MSSVAVRHSVSSSGAAISHHPGQDVFHTLNLRDSIAKKEKAISIRLNEQSKKRSNMRELLVQNFMKKYNQWLDPSHSTANVQVQISKIISYEVESFMEREKNAMNQKTLRKLEKDIETIVLSDARISPFLNNTSRNQRRDLSL